MNRSILLDKPVSNKREDKVLLLLIIVFIIYPFAAFVLALTQASKRSSYLIYFLFGLIFAWHLAPTGADRFDDLQIIMQRVTTTNISFEKVGSQLVDLITFSKNAPKEWYETFMICVSKSFTSNPHFYFVLSAIPWLIFELSSLDSITSDKKFRESLTCLIILLLFVFPRDIISIQNPRFTTATWCAIYTTIRYFGNGRYSKIYGLLIFITPLIHSAFWFYVIAFILGNIMLNFPKVSLFLLYLSVPFSYLSYDLIVSINIASLPLPTVLTAWIGRYMSESAYEHFVLNTGASGFYWIGNLFGIIMKTAYLIIPFYIIKYKGEISKDKQLWKLCRFFIFYFALVSFIQFVPVLGERFYWLVQILGIYVWFKAIYPRHNWVIYLILLGCSWGIFRRYFYHGAVESSVPLGILIEPLPMLINDML